jgi:hypothetical protein
MQTWIKCIWIFATIVNTISLVWFLLGSTANFQRSLDLVGLVTLVLMWVPSLVLVLVSIKLLLNGWVPSSSISYFLFWFMIFNLLSFALPLLDGVDTRGWLYESVETDPIKLTSDGKYEYRIELINMWQKNSHERLFVRNVLTGEEKFIPVEINTDELKGISQGSHQNWAWAIMAPTDDLDHYELSTTENLRMTQKKFLIDVIAGTSRRIE